ncbi:sodium:solute symporter family protein [Roseivirga sp. BDSF3-8]|uniref:sodium:solute symporter family protein n=1 Tax=Roseivirga sp. BDSF3-8 TaxID=3241598 RepID=UPI0035326138
MVLTFWDGVIIVTFLVISLIIGLYFSKRASKDISEFFLGGRNLPWWIAGTSMVATTFAADTPLAVTELVATDGVAGNWLWWNMLAGGMLTVFFFARYWRRAEILTDVELIELRYSGKPAAFLRGFKAIYLGLFMNSLIIGWVNLALMSLLQVFFDIPEDMLIWYIAGAMILVTLYSSLSGLLGVAFTDLIQFTIAMAGCIILAVLVINSEDIGGIEGLKTALPDGTLNLFPTIGSEESSGTVLALSLGSFLTFVGLQWWASWYPGSEPGGGGYIAQRMMSAKNEKHAVYATLFFQIAHYCLRPWPWILVGLSAIVLYPELPAADKKLGFVMAMRDFLPPGLRGLLLVAFFAAYMSTISTQLNWGTSYLVNDIVKRFTKAGNKQLLLASRIGTILVMAVALFITSHIETIEGVWKLLLEAGAGLGLVLILRWFWWRVNAYSEITATIFPLLAYLAGHYWLNLEFPESFVFILITTSIAWLVVTFLTRPTDRQHLKAFYERIRPDGWWGPFQDADTSKSSWARLRKLTICWLSAIIMAYSTLFLIGKVIFMEWTEAAIYLLTAVVSLSILLITAKQVRIFGD